jgi:hypothetical protein
MGAGHATRPHAAPRRAPPTAHDGRPMRGTPGPGRASLPCPGRPGSARRRQRLRDAREQIGEERVGGDARESESKPTASTPRSPRTAMRAEPRAEIVAPGRARRRRARRRREGQRDMGQGEDLARPGLSERLQRLPPLRRPGCCRAAAARVPGSTSPTTRHGIGARRGRQDAVERGIGAGDEQRAEAGAAVEVEQHDLAAVRRQPRIERGEHRRRARRSRPPPTGRSAPAAGRRAARPRASRSICACSAAVSRCVWRAALTGKELYLNGLNSGWMSSQAVLAKRGSSAGSPAIPAKRAKAVTPTMGEISTTALGARQARVLDAHRAHASAPARRRWNSRPGAAGPAGTRPRACAHREARRGHPVLPYGRRRGRRARCRGPACGWRPRAKPRAR